MKNAVFWNVTPCGSCKKRRFGGAYRFHHQGDKNRRAKNKLARNSVEEAHDFANHLADVFQVHLSECEPEREEALTQLLESPRVPLPNRTANQTLQNAEVQEVVSNLNPKKSSCYDLITGKILKELRIIGIKYLTQIFNVVLLEGYFLAQWKVAQVILILKTTKPPNKLISYRPLSLLPFLSIFCENLLLKRLLKRVKNNGFTPNHQFRFRERHCTIEQARLIV
jgi:hypothetical protein